MSTQSASGGPAPWLLDILRCPVGLHRVRLSRDDSGEPVLICEQDCDEPGRRRQYPIENGIPVLLPDAATMVSAPVA